VTQICAEAEILHPDENPGLSERPIFGGVVIGQQKGRRIDRERPVRSWRFGEACFDAVALRLTVGGAVAELEPRPLQLLALLLTHAGEVVTKDEILEALWPDRVVTEASLTKCVARLRAALSDSEHTVIRTVHGYGYSFDAPVTVKETGATPSSDILKIWARLLFMAP
jgi:DNA-binding winged helix-turn-helix (wHTH) protein